MCFCQFSPGFFPDPGLLPHPQGGEAAWSPHLLGLSYLPWLLLTPSILLIEYVQGFIFSSSGHSLGALIVMHQIPNVLKKIYLF